MMNIRVVSDAHQVLIRRGTIFSPSHITCSWDVKEIPVRCTSWAANLTSVTREAAGFLQYLMLQHTSPWVFGGRRVLIVKKKIFCTQLIQAKACLGCSWEFSGGYSIQVKGFSADEWNNWSPSGICPLRTGLQYKSFAFKLFGTRHFERSACVWRRVCLYAKNYNF